MDILILGILMLNKCTIYEMRKQIDLNFTAMSSSSMGSIQAAVKKLLQNGMAIFNEYVENGVNKKVYEITDAGKEYFRAGISKPMAYKEKSMELIKFFFMGFADKDKRLDLIEAYIAELGNSLAFLEQVKRTVDSLPEINADYLLSLRDSGITSELTVADAQDIAFFQAAMLDLSITKIKAEIEWFQNFKKRMGAK